MYMDNPEIINVKKRKTKKIKPEFIIIEETSPKNITLKSSSSSKRSLNGTNKHRHKRKKKIKTRKRVELEILDEPEIVINDDSIKKTIELEISEKNKVSKRRLKIPVELEIMEEKKRYNEEFIELMDNLNNIMLKQGEPFRARAYQKAQETIMTYPDDIFNPNQLKGLPGIGSTILDKLNEYVETGTLRILEREKTNPINILADVYGIGPKKAQELVNVGIKTINDLRVRQDELLNDIQKVGLKYYEEIQERIPRSEIEEYDNMFNEVFKSVSKGSPDAKFEIVGSYRRGAQTSGDIDVIITGKTGEVYKKFVDKLLEMGVILEVLSRGPSKTLVISRLPGQKSQVARRVDFLYAPPDEFAFAILYFTGSKIFNTVMRQYGLDKGYTFNEHGIYKLENKKKGSKVDKEFKTEKDIFDFLGLEFKTPIERRDGRAVIPYTDVGSKITDVVGSPPTLVKEEEEIIEIVPVKKNKTLKKRQPKQDVKLIDNETDIINIIENFKHNGISVLETLNEKQLTDIIHVANTKYYNQTPIMTDNQYDIVKEFIEQKFPNNVAITEIQRSICAVVQVRWCKWIIYHNWYKSAIVHKRKWKSWTRC